MNIKVINVAFILIGVVVGSILSLQIRANPVKQGSFPLDKLEIQKALLSTFSAEQESLKQELQSIEKELADAQAVIARRSSRQTVQHLNDLKELTALDTVTGSGIRITLSDNPGFDRIDFSALNENFVQSADLRDLVNGLFLKDAAAIAVNAKRVSPLTPIQSVFDSILVGNFQIVSPFVIEVVGNPLALQEALAPFVKRKIHIFVEVKDSLQLKPLDSVRTTHYLSAYMQ